MKNQIGKGEEATYVAVQPVKIRGVDYEPGQVIPDTARYRGIQSLIRRGKVVITKTAPKVELDAKAAGLFKRLHNIK